MRQLQFVIELIHIPITYIARAFEYIDIKLTRLEYYLERKYLERTL